MSQEAKLSPIEIIYMPTLDWEWMFQRPQQLLSRMAPLGYKVYYCNATQRPGAPPEQIGEGVTVVHDFPSFMASRDFSLPVVLWASWPGHWNVLEQLRAQCTHNCLVVYDIVDYFPQWRKFDSQMTELADVLIVASQPLYERYVNSSKPVFLIRNAVDFALFNKVTQGSMPVPRDMLYVKPPVIGFIGALGNWIDVEILAALGEEADRCGWSVVLVGPPFGATIPRSSSIISLGYKPYHDLPCYLARFDVCILPFDRSPTAMSSNPIKLYEYLASGKPVVATSIPEALTLKELVYVAANAEEFIFLIHRALESPMVDVERRVEFARANSWEARAMEVHHVIQHMWQQERGRHILV